MVRPTKGEEYTQEDTKEGKGGGDGRGVSHDMWHDLFLGEEGNRQGAASDFLREVEMVRRRSEAQKKVRERLGFGFYRLGSGARWTRCTSS
jgi:hypothetical protein